MDIESFFAVCKGIIDPKETNVFPKAENGNFYIAVNDGEIEGIEIKKGYYCFFSKGKWRVLTIDASEYTNSSDLRICGNCLNYGDEAKKCSIRRNLPVVNIWNTCDLWTFDRIKRETRFI